MDIENCDIIFDSLSLITSNKALIGGGMRIVNFNNKKLVLPKNYPFSDNVKANNAEIYGDDATTYL